MKLNYGSAPNNAVKVVDSTLREGCQAAGVAFDANATAEIATFLAQLGIDTVECGHPAISEAERQRILAARAALPNTPLLCHARATSGDVRAAAEVKAEWVGVFVGVNDLALSARHSIGSLQDVLVRIGSVVREAQGLGLQVRFTLEDASRTSQQPAIDAYSRAVEAGASRICFADTVGILRPEQVKEWAQTLTREFPTTPIEFHLHDDRGLALANSLAAIDGGATWISSSVNGLGERCGITDLASLLANLHYEQLRPLDHPDLLHELSSRVRVHSNTTVDERRPVVGERAFTHCARLHRLAVEKDPRTYEWTEPTELGRSHEFAAKT